MHVGLTLIVSVLARAQILKNINAHFYTLCTHTRMYLDWDGIVCVYMKLVLVMVPSSFILSTFFLLSTTILNEIGV